MTTPTMLDILADSGWMKTEWTRSEWLAQRLADALAEVERLRPREAYAAGLSLTLKAVLDGAEVPNIPSPELDVRVKVLVEQRDEARAEVERLQRLADNRESEKLEARARIEAAVQEIERNEDVGYARARLLQILRGEEEK